ncbi:unnamed protein product [Adineta steineri]|uniref:Uncharacterized protein n=1 Tax=Adineta steineri TaxID=433720 RepID=A0A815QX51_9BILA|nr:unnamed protein product [Adineta steineri]CAF1469064.1 unnamed protein product [Adineta steineri]CAF1469610.1 unnamed protein product [Adineta steineri]
MPRHCAECHGITPNFQVNFCQHCGKTFGTRIHRPTSIKSRPSVLSLPPERTPSDTVHRHHPSVTSKSLRTGLPSSSPSHSSSSYSLKSRPISIERKRRETSHDDSHKRSNSCQYKIICGEYLSSLKWQEVFFNRKHNRCYCNECYPMSCNDTFETGGSTYVIPRNWCRFGLHVDQVRAQTDHIWNQWIITYHGTSAIAAESIVNHRQFLIPGDRCIDGTSIYIHPDHIKDKYEIYTSPTIAYSSLSCYCPAQQFRSKLTNKLYNAQIVLQCRQKPGAFKVQAETVGAGNERICSVISNDQVEILTTIRAAIVPYGVLIKLTEINRNDY